MLVALEKPQGAVKQVVHTLKSVALADGPGEGTDLDAELVLEFIQQVKPIPPLQVHLVDEDDDGGVTHAAHLHQALGLGLDTLDTVDDQDHAVHCGERAVGVLGKVAVTGRVQEVDQAVLVFEGHDRCRHRDATLPLDVHEVRGRRFGDLIGLDRSGRLNGPTKQEEFFRQRGFARVGVADDGEGFSPGDFLGQCGHGAAKLAYSAPA